MSRFWKFYGNNLFKVWSIVYTLVILLSRTVLTIYIVTWILSSRAFSLFAWLSAYWQTASEGTLLCAYPIFCEIFLSNNTARVSKCLVDTSQSTCAFRFRARNVTISFPFLIFFSWVNVSISFYSSSNDSLETLQRILNCTLDFIV